MSGLPELIKETVRERTDGMPAPPVPWAALRQRRRQHSLRVGATVAAAAVACAAVLLAGVQLGPWRGSAEVNPARTGPSALLGVWKAETPGGDDWPVLGLDRWFVHFGPGQCAQGEFSWVASPDGHFTASGELSGAEACRSRSRAERLKPLPEVPQPTWLTEAVRYRVEGDGWVLLGPDGRVTARLTPSTADFNWNRSRTVVNHRNPAPARVFPPLPAGHRPVTAAELVGIWAPAGTTSDGSQIEFSADGYAGMKRWLIDDQGGVWLSEDGAFRYDCKVPPGGIPDDCAEVKNWFDGRPVGYEQGQLVLYDDDSSRVAHRLVRR